MAAQTVRPNQNLRRLFKFLPAPLRPPPGLSTEMHRFFLIALFFFIPGGFIHLLFVFLFMYLGLTVLALFNVASAFLFFYGLYRHTRGKYAFAAYSCNLVEIPLHGVLATVYLGLGSGFWLYVFIAPMFGLWIPLVSFRFRVVFAVFFLFLMIGLFIYASITPPLVEIDHSWTSFFLIMNLVSAFVITMVAFATFERAVVTAESTLEALNENLQETVSVQVGEIERTSRLRRFLSPQVAQVIESEGASNALKSHRAEITVLFADLRGFTNFADRNIPDTVMAALNAYHGLAGPLINKYEGTLERFAGDGFMVFFNDPVPVQDPGLRAARLALALHAGFGEALDSINSEESPLGLGVGIAQGPATLGPIGFEDRFDYAAIGSVTNLASRLCDRAADGQILASKEVFNALRGYMEMEKIGDLSFKGFSDEISVYAINEMIDTGHGVRTMQQV